MLPPGLFLSFPFSSSFGVYSLVLSLVMLVTRCSCFSLHCHSTTLLLTTIMYISHVALGFGRLFHIALLI